MEPSWPYPKAREAGMITEMGRAILIVLLLSGCRRHSSDDGAGPYYRPS